MSYVIKVHGGRTRPCIRYGTLQSFPCDGWVRVTRKRHRVEITEKTYATAFRSFAVAEGLALYISAKNPDWFGKVEIREVVYHPGREFTTREIGQCTR